jgi:hypothetical protein
VLKARIETLEAELAKLEATSAGHRADFEHERDRCERLLAEVLKATADQMVARETAARLAGAQSLPSTPVVAPLDWMKHIGASGEGFKVAAPKVGLGQWSVPRRTNLIQLELDKTSEIHLRINGTSPSS